jgi:deazaflavin-dependent oxidoreductase (nitroreductase family)
VSPLGRRVARFNRLVTNRVTKPFARLLPGFGVVVHRGRVSGREYETPVNVFRTPDGYVFALTYSRRAEWVQNVVAAGGCELITRGRRVRLADPKIFRDERRTPVPSPVRWPLHVLGVTDFLLVRPVAPPPEKDAERR